MSKWDAKISTAEFAKIAAGFVSPFIVFDLPGAAETKARGINIHGDIAGTCVVGQETHGFCRFAATGNFRQIDIPKSLTGESVTSTKAAGINDDGYIVGEFPTDTGHEYGYRLKPFDEKSELKDEDFRIVDLRGAYQRPLKDLSEDAKLITEAKGAVIKTNATRINNQKAL